MKITYPDKQLGVLLSEHEQSAPNHPTRWRKCNIPELIGGDYALRLLLTSVVIRGEAKKQVEELVNEIRMEINSRPEECSLWETVGMAIKWGNPE